MTPLDLTPRLGITGAAYTIMVKNLHTIVKNTYVMAALDFSFYGMIGTHVFFTKKCYAFCFFYECILGPLVI